MTYDTPTISNRPVVILGAGVLGRRIACTWSAAGYEVNLRDLSESILNAALLYVHQNVSSPDYTTLTKEYRKPGEVKIFTDLAAAVQNAWLVVEAVPEKLELKQSTMAELEKLAPKDCIIGSNSSSYKSSLMVEGRSDEFRERVCNTHYQMPPAQRTVELMTDGATHPEIFPFLTRMHEDIGMVPATARVESTGFIMNRIWAAIKREIMMELCEGVTEPDQIDKLFKHMFQSPVGPCALMDNVGLDTVAFIEDNYIKERELSGKKTVDWLRKKYISKGFLGAKSGKGGLYPPGGALVHNDEKGEKSHRIDNHSIPLLYVLDVGLGPNAAGIEDPKRKGRVLSISADGGYVRELVKELPLPDGLRISVSEGRMFWTNMGGSTSANDGSVMSAKLDGSDVNIMIKEGDVHTPKQLVLDEENKKVYFCDREGMRVHRCEYDGSNHVILVQTGDFNKKEQMADQTRWCVGITIDTKNRHIYWSQKGTSKGGQGRIFRAGLDIPIGETPESRSDIELQFENLPEPIDLEISPDTQTLYWTDRGEHPTGNTLNKAEVGRSGKREKVILTSHFNEAIGLRLDAVNQHIYITDLSGAVYRVDKGEAKNKKVVYQCDGTFTGIDLAYVN